jgi:protoporphyrinogen oxidase
LEDGSHVAYERLISTVPIPKLIELIGEGATEEVIRHGEGLNNNVVHTVNIGFEGALNIDETMHWVYFPIPGTVFHRLSFPHAFSDWMVPAGCSSVQAEISESRFQPQDRGTLVQQTLQGLVEVGLVGPDDIRPVKDGGRLRVAEVVTLDPAYIIYDLEHAENTGFLKGWFLAKDIETRGRFGEWEYFNMDHAILSGHKAAKASLVEAT